MKMRSGEGQSEECVRLNGALLAPCEEGINIFKFKSPVLPAAKSVSLEQPAITPCSDCIGMHMEKMGHFRNS